jgi:hypothetical protein
MTANNNLYVGGSITCSSLKTSGVVPFVDSSYQTLVYTLKINQRGFITIYSSSLSMYTCFFDYYPSSYPSITCIAQSGNATQGVVNSPGTSSAGTQQLVIQLVGTNIQVKTLTSGSVTVYWYAVLF